MGIDPIIELGIDNCFASKHWTLPEQWCELIAGLGLRCIEASADTECDPLYMGVEYTEDWIARVKNACARYGVQITNFYSGHGTYATLGLAHWDARVRTRFRDQWMKRQAKTAAAFGAGLGFFAHAFDESVLQSPDAYEEAMDTLCHDLADIAVYAAQNGLPSAGVEQMYAPHQPPWTIDGAKEMLRRIYAIGGVPFYLTDDVGHMNGQQFFLRPTEQSILQDLEAMRTGVGQKRVWMGSRRAMQAFRRAVSGELPQTEAVDTILAEAEVYPYLFAQPQDGSPYTWLEKTGCWSPIVHLQQSDGKSSPHWPFDEAHNAAGIIHGQGVLRALAKAYEQDVPEDMPPACPRITLTLEPFISTAGNIHDAVAGLQDSVTYWRQFLPTDGMRLSEVITRLDAKQAK